MRRLPLEQKRAILAEYDEGGVSHAELAAKYGIGESTISTWRRRQASAERRCTVCGGPPLPGAIAYRGSLLCVSCGRAKRTAKHRIYYLAHKEEIDATSSYANRPSGQKAKDRDRIAEKYFRNQEVLHRILKRMMDRSVDWGDDYSLVNQQQLNNPAFIVVDARGVKHKENLTSPLPEWDET